MKFKNNTKYLVSFNVATTLADGTNVPKWFSIAAGEYLETEDKTVIAVASLQTEIVRATDGLKGYLTVVDEKEKVAEKPKKSK